MGAWLLSQGLLRKRWITGGAMLVFEVKVKYLTITYCFLILQGWLIFWDILSIIFHQSKF